MDNVKSRFIGNFLMRPPVLRDHIWFSGRLITGFTPLTCAELVAHGEVIVASPVSHEAIRYGALDGTATLILQQYMVTLHVMTSSNGNIFRVTGPLCGEFTGTGEFPNTKASDAELWCFFHLRLINDWVNNRKAGDLRRHPAHYDIIVMQHRKDYVRTWKHSPHYWLFLPGIHQRDRWILHPKR